MPVYTRYLRMLEKVITSPDLPFFSGEWSHSRTTPLEHQAMEELQKIRVQMQEENGRQIFSDRFLERRHPEATEDQPLDCCVGLIERTFGYLRQNDHYPHRPIRVLQIGPGNNGARQSKLLRQLGAEAYNLDNLNSHDLCYNKGCQARYEPEDHFTVGSWMNIDQYFEEDFFEVIFIQDMGRGVEDEIYQLDPERRLVQGYLKLMDLTFSRMNPHWGLFFVQPQDDTSFYLPATLTQLPITAFLEHGWKGHSLTPEYTELSIPKDKPLTREGRIIQMYYWGM